MQSDLATITLSDEADVWIYAWGSDQFTPHKYYEFYFRDIRAHEAFGWIWKSRSTMKIKVFGWLLLADRLNTRNMLKRRHYNIGDDHNCILCGLSIEETLEHLFFECHFSTDCWATMGLSWPQGMPRLQNVTTAKQRWNGPLFMEMF